MSQPFVPIYCRPPNVLLEYVQQDFDDGAGHKAILTVAVFKNKGGKIESMVAQVKWQKGDSNGKNAHCTKSG